MRLAPVPIAYHLSVAQALDAGAQLLLWLLSRRSPPGSRWRPIRALRHSTIHGDFHQFSSILDDFDRIRVGNLVMMTV